MFLFLHKALAQATSSSITSPQKLIEAVDRLGRWMYALLFVVATVFILVAAYNFLNAGGDEENLEKAKKQIFYAIVAIIVAVLAGGAVKLIQNFLG